LEVVNDIEMNVLKKVKGVSGFSQLLATGKFPGKLLKFIIMDKLGYNLK